MKKILVVEDDKFLSNAYHVKLTAQGYDVQETPDGKSGMELMESFGPDLVILDLVMPGKDGFWFLEELSKNDKLKKIPVLVVTNLGEESDKEKVATYNVVDYMIKSDTSVEDLVARVKKFV